MGTYEARIFINNSYKTTLKVKNSTTLDEVYSLCNSNFEEDEKYFFLTKNGDIIRNNSYYTVGDVIKEDIIYMKSEEINYKANIYIDGNFKTIISISKNTTLNQIRERCGSIFLEDVNYFFTLKNGDIIKNIQNISSEDVKRKDHNEYRIDFKSEEVIYLVNIYIDYNLKTYINISKSTTLRQIREKCNSIFQEDVKYYFIKDNNDIIKNEEIFTAKDVWKKEKEEDVRKIVLKSEEVSKKVFLYLNNFKTSVISYKISMKLKDIKNKAGKDINKNEIFFLTKEKVIIEEENLNDLTARDVIVYENGETIIRFTDRDNYKRQQVIDYLEKLKQISGHIDWYKENEFFKRIEDLAGPIIANEIKIQLTEAYKNPNEKVDDKKYLNQFYLLLLNKDNNPNRVPAGGF